MTIDADIDSTPATGGKSLFSNFESTEDFMQMGIRVRPSDLARLLGVTKQAVSKWIKQGRITLGADGRVDPRVAVNRLIATGDPARLRSAFLKPLVTELGALRLRIVELEKAALDAKEDNEFNRDSASELITLFDTLETNLGLEWDELRKLAAEHGLGLLLEWLNYSLEHGPHHGRSIVELIDGSLETPTDTKEGIIPPPLPVLACG